VLYYYILYAYIRYCNTTDHDDELQAALTRSDFSASCARIINILDRSAKETRIWIDVIGQSNATCSDKQGKHNKTVII